MSDKELQYQQGESGGGLAGVEITDVVDALVQQLADPDPQRYSKTLQSLGDLISTLIVQRRLGLAATTLRSLRQLANDNAETSKTKQADIQQTLQKVGSSTAIQEILQVLQTGDLVTDDDVVGELLRCVDPGNFATILRIREKTSRNSFRVTLDSVMNDALALHPARFIELCHEPDSLVACAAIQLVGQSSREAVEMHLLPLLEHQNAKIRVALLEVMVLHGSPKLLRAMVGALHDTHRDVRCAAAWGLGTWRFPPSFDPLKEMIESKEFRETPMIEMRAMFSAFARVGQSQALPLLGRILNKKSLFGGRESPEMRACAARALGALRSPEAEAQLQRAVDDKDNAVRRAVLRSLMSRQR